MTRSEAYSLHIDTIRATSGERVSLAERHRRYHERWVAVMAEVVAA
jgi:hypothetical protein